MSQFELVWGPEVRTNPSSTVINGEWIIPDGAEFVTEESGQSKQSQKCQESDWSHHLISELSKIPANK